MATRFYLRSLTSSDAPTSGEKSSALPIGTDNTQSTNQSLALSEITPSAAGSETSISFSTLGQTAQQSGMIARFTSQPLAAQTISANTWSIFQKVAESNGQSNIYSVGSIYIWRKSTGVVGYIYDSATELQIPYRNPGSTALADAEWESAGTGTALGTISGSSITTQANDVLVYEVWYEAQQGKSNTYSGTFYFNGQNSTTTGNNNDAAAYIEFPGTINFNVVSDVTVNASGAGATVQSAAAIVSASATVNAGSNQAISSVGDATVSVENITTVAVSGLAAAVSTNDISPSGASNVTATTTVASTAVGTAVASGTTGPLAHLYLPLQFTFGQFAGNVDRTVNATGVQATTAAGSVAVSASATTLANGAQAATSVGTATTAASAAVPAAGVAATVNVGSPSVAGSATVTATGVQAAVSLGQASTAAGATTVVSGVQAQVAAGAVSTAGTASVAASGVSAATQTGNATVAGAANTQAAGVGLTSAVGSVEITNNTPATVAVTGVALTTSVGTATVTGTANVLADGVAAALALGVVTVDVGQVQRVGGGLAPRKKKQRTFKEEREARRDLERAIRRAVGTVYGDDDPTVLVTGDTVAIVTQQTSPIAVPVPPAFNADTVARLIAAEFARIGVEATRRNTRATLDEIQERERQRVARRKRQDEEIFLLIEGM